MLVPYLQIARRWHQNAGGDGEQPRTSVQCGAGMGQDATEARNVPAFAFPYQTPTNLQSGLRLIVSQATKTFQERRRPL